MKLLLNTYYTKKLGLGAGFSISQRGKCLRNINSKQFLVKRFTPKILNCLLNAIKSLTKSISLQVRYRSPINFCPDLSIEEFIFLNKLK
jgi:hypothetical protein